MFIQYDGFLFSYSSPFGQYLSITKYAFCVSDFSLHLKCQSEALRVPIFISSQENDEYK